jgi:hypothetical protein
MFREYFIKRRVERENYKIKKVRRDNRQTYYTVSFNEFIIGWREFVEEITTQYEKNLEFETKGGAKQFIEKQISKNYKKLTK